MPSADRVGAGEMSWIPPGLAPLLIGVQIWLYVKKRRPGPASPIAASGAT